jgi:hypothetical protein
MTLLSRIRALFTAPIEPDDGYASIMAEFAERERKCLRSGFTQGVGAVRRDRQEFVHKCLGAGRG